MAAGFYWIRTGTGSADPWMVAEWQPDWQEGGCWWLTGSEDEVHGASIRRL